MASTVTAQQRSLPVRTLDGIRLKPASVGPGVRPPSIPVDAVDAGGLTLGDVARDTLAKLHGSWKAACIEFKVDESLFKRELDACKLSRLDQHPTDRAAVVDAWNKTFGVLTDPYQRTKQVIREAREKLDEIEQGVEALRS